MNKQEYAAAHEHAVKNKEELQKSNICGCYYCQAIFSPNEIEDWIPFENTALCPYCGIDSVIGDASGYSITKEFLKELNEDSF